MRVASEHHLSHTDFLEWDSADRDAEFELRSYQAEECDGCGVHPTDWKESEGGYRNAWIPTWKFCRVCELLSQAQEAGPPTDKPGWRLVLAPSSKRSE